MQFKITLYRTRINASYDIVIIYFLRLLLYIFIILMRVILFLYSKRRIFFSIFHYMRDMAQANPPLRRSLTEKVKNVTLLAGRSGARALVRA